MPVSVGRSLAIIFTVAGTIFFTRLIPFLFFPKGKEIPPIIRYLGRMLPPAVIGMLVIYCLKDGVTNPLRTGLHEAAGVGVTAASYIWKHNTLLSILLGTVTYMLAIRFLPI